MGHIMWRGLLWSRATMVEVVKPGEAGTAPVGFAAISCPVLLQPSVVAHRSFSRRLPSLMREMWAPLAYAAGLGLPLPVFRCSGEPVRLPRPWRVRPALIAITASPASFALSFLRKTSAFRATSPDPGRQGWAGGGRPLGTSSLYIYVRTSYGGMSRGLYDVEHYPPTVWASFSPNLMY